MFQVCVHCSIPHPSVVSVCPSVSLGRRRTSHHAAHHPPGLAGHSGRIHRGSQHPREVVPRQVRHSVELPSHHARPGGGRRLSHAQGRRDGPHMDVTG